MIACLDCADLMDQPHGRGLCARCYKRHHAEGTLEHFAVRQAAPPLLDISWHVDALCAETDAEIFFPEKGGSTRQAKSVCVQCVVRAECLDYALNADERFGIWGGLSERDRRRLKRLERAAA